MKQKEAENTEAVEGEETEATLANANRPTLELLIYKRQTVKLVNLQT